MRDISLRLSAREASDMTLIKEALRRLGEDPSQWDDVRIVKRIIDARQRQVKVNVTVRVSERGEGPIKPQAVEKHYQDVHDSGRRAIIVGSGPAGLFAALRCLERGIKPIVLERGADVDSRLPILAQISRTGVVDPETNYSFGEGGAGTFSDGKLYTRSKKRGSVTEVLSVLYHHGASEDILIDAHPHIGSDKLPKIIKNIRLTIERHGGEVRFHSKVTNLLLRQDGGITEAIGVELESGECLYGPVILATGHSARDVYRMLLRQGVEMQAKGIAIGTRLEHPQHLIDTLQYHSKEGRGRWLPAAEYSYVCQADERGVYSFCMCPGGVIVPAATEPGQCVVNGMSASGRSSRHANAGMVVELHPGDIPGFEEAGALEMMELQESLEHRFYDDRPSGCGNLLNAPAQRLPDFLAGRESKDLPRSSYPPGIHSSRIDKLLPAQIAERLKQGYREFGRRCPGFITEEALLVGLESRTSSPVRLPRNPATLEHASVRGLYPAGEGAGYAGGIVSAAIDGIRCADSLGVGR